MMARGLFAGMFLQLLAVACGGGGSVVGEFRMQGLTMTPTLADGTALKAIDYGGQRPERGDIIVFRSSTYPDRSFVKRVIGLPGDTVEVSETTGEVRLQRRLAGRAVRMRRDGVHRNVRVDTAPGIQRRGARAVRLRCLLLRDGGQQRGSGRFSGLAARMAGYESKALSAGSR